MKITYRKYGEAPRSQESIVEEIRQKVLDAELGVIKAEKAIRAAMDKLKKAKEKRDRAFIDNIATTEAVWSDATAEEGERAYNEEGHLVAYKDYFQKKWITCYLNELNEEVYQSIMDSIKQLKKEHSKK